ncbi:unnamed protein product [Brachionus calyciflorus]|uniref:Protein N-terminal asparagine amidohydrolase n=1 Tax=Brachionus calyciflorus TaxID=104777 RepID=A0A813MWJ0_9BILA|nr:unnamed protein product [Brachionus calyciflorus]
MTILLSDKIEIKNFNYSQIESDTLLKKNSEEFINSPKNEQDAFKCLFVGQREYVTVTHNDPLIDIIGSDDATTCHIILLVDESNYNCSLCHLDGSDTHGGLNQMVESLKALRTNTDDSSEFSVFLVGGFEDSNNSSQELTNQIFDALLNRSEIFNLKLCINTKLNSIKLNNVNFPMIYGLGYEIKNKKVFMCNKFLDKGPDFLARSARHFSTNGNMNIYDPVECKLIIRPFSYKVYDYIPQCIDLPENVLLKYFSTSPEQEPAHFSANLREVFKFMCKHPKPLKTYFINNEPFIYVKKDDGSWNKI